MKTFYWLVKREFWEHRGGFLWAPLVTGGVFLLLNLMGIVTGEVFGFRHGIRFGSMDFASALNHLGPNDAGKIAMVVDTLMVSSSVLLKLVLGIVVFFYLLGSLYDDRRDRSLLFWKSLPLSDTETVASKLVAGLVVAPAIAFVTSIVAGLLMLAMYATALSFHGVNVWPILAMAHPLRTVSGMLAMIPLYLLWALPSAGWLMLCSAWARSKPFLWAVVPPVAAAIVVGWFNMLGGFGLQTGWFWKNIVGRAFGVLPNGIPTGLGPLGEIENVDKAAQLGQYIATENVYGPILARTELWAGVVIGLALLAVAAWLRRWRTESSV
ncbi:hypothetical protein ASG87_18685 [Frateuria sp. Soil773]|uniref:hypothetical protein n=1 Tax=Frateuria sp. Soil773 TaxID=1736407 RepID=UPI0006F2FBF2|nr:hypothetical protein [Frateuria sp. Soil773]KRE90581.1 hypothetical protein ASG87_18685 [Frateuria sp. Soil773]